MYVSLVVDRKKKKWNISFYSQFNAIVWKIRYDITEFSFTRHTASALFLFSGRAQNSRISLFGKKTKMKTRILYTKRRGNPACVPLLLSRNELKRTQQWSVVVNFFSLICLGIFKRCNKLKLKSSYSRKNNKTIRSFE